MSALRTRKGPRTLIGLLAALGLVAMFAMPAAATHVAPELIDIPQGEGQPDCADLGFDAGFAIGSNSLVDGTYGGPDFEVDVDFSGDDGGQPTTLAFSNADPLVNGVFIKGGQDGNLYTYAAGEDADDGLVSPDGKAISHVLFCYNTPSESEAPPPSVEESELPAESEVPAESEAPAESEREDTLGGTPTPAPEVPDTAMGDVGQLPATVLSLVLVGALAAMVYVRMARER